MKSRVEYSRNPTKEDLPTEEEVENDALSGSNFFTRLFKISKVERPLFCVLCTLFFIISYVYSVIRDIKDGFVMERLDPGSIPYLKMLIVLPGNIVAILIIQKMLSTRSLSKVFSIVTVFFSLFFIIYGLMLMFDIRSYLEPDMFRGIDPFSDGKKSLIGMEWSRAFYLVVVSWTTTLVYLFAELWGSCVLSFLFLSFANSICTKKQSFRYTPLLLISSNVALVLSGLTMKLVSKYKESMEWEWFRNLCTGLFILLGFLSLSISLIHKYFEKSILLKKVFIPSDSSKKGGKLKIGMLEGLKEIFTSKLVLSMSFMVLAYSITVNMAESPFKAVMPKVSEEQENVSRLSVALSTNADNQIYIGLAVIAILVFKLSDIIHIFGWFSVAIIPPLFSLLSTLIYFPIIHANVIYKSGDESFLGKILPSSFLSYTTEMQIGQFTVAVYKILKYAAFDVCKEVISMAIDPVYRAHYKSIFDGICGKLGKAMGSGVTTFENFVMDTSDVRISALYSLFIVVLLDILWILAVIYLSKKYEASIKSNKYIEDEKVL